MAYFIQSMAVLSFTQVAITTITNYYYFLGTKGAYTTVSYPLSVIFKWMYIWQVNLKQTQTRQSVSEL